MTVNAPLWAVGSVEPLLAAYAAGTLPPPLEAVVSAHLALDRTNHRLVDDLTVLAAEEMEGLAPKPLANRERVLASVLAAVSRDEPAAETPGRRAEAARPQSAGALPLPLARYLAGSLGHPTTIDTLPWRPVLPGLRQWVGARDEGWTLRLLRGRAGVAIPHHGHRGAEITLVVTGGLIDGEAHFHAGDLSVSGEDDDHRPRVDDSGECICAVVSAAPIRLSGPIGWVVNPFLKD